MVNKANAVAYFTMTAVTLGCFVFGACGTFLAHKIKAMRGRTPDPRTEKSVDVLVLIVRILSAVVLALSGYLLYRLFLICGCVFPPKT